MCRRGIASASSALARLQNNSHRGATMKSIHRIPETAGIGLRLAHLAEIVATPVSTAWLEIHPENFLANPHAAELLAELSTHYPISFHTVGISVGSVGGIDPSHLK